MVEQQHRVPARLNLGRDGHELQVHRFGVAPGQDEADGFPLRGTDGAEDIGGGGALIRGSRRAAAAPRPAACDLVLLAVAGFVFEPDFYVGDIDALLVRDACQQGREVFLNASMAPAAWAWWRGRADS